MQHDITTSTNSNLNSSSIRGETVTFKDRKLHNQNLKQRSIRHFSRMQYECILEFNSNFCVCCTCHVHPSFINFFVGVHRGSHTVWFSPLMECSDVIKKLYSCHGLGVNRNLQHNTNHKEWFDFWAQFR